MNIRDEWNALGKLIGLALQFVAIITPIFTITALADLLGI